MRGKPKEIETTELCAYGCGNVAKYKTVGGKLICESSPNKCPFNKKKNSASIKLAHEEGRIPGWSNIPSEKLKRDWAKGLTKETSDKIKGHSEETKKKISCKSKGRRHSEETKKKISEFRIGWLKKSENRKNLGRYKKSWMEETFEAYLIEHEIYGWETEKHFWSESLRKNFYPDFLFEEKKLIIELDGTQHRKTVDLDTKRDIWFTTIGYRIVRITHAEFKERFFSKKGFNDLII